MSRPTPALAALLALSSVALGLVLSEVALRVRDDFALPHVHVYQADAELGVRLRPGTSQRIAFGGNDASTFTVNSLGYRGVDWPSGLRDAVLVVGDSQVFGLGVEDEETFSRRLAERTGRPVLNGGVPTYGPDEYLAVAAEVMASQDVTDLVVVLNLSNDLFELDVPNTARHAVWDGWAVRSETAPDDVRQFPGRGWLMANSHLVYNLRGLMVRPSSEGSLPSEGSLEDVVEAVSADLQASQSASEQAEEERVAQARAYGSASQRAMALPQREMMRLHRSLPGVSVQDITAMDAVRQGASPGDIVANRYAEAARPVTVTAELLRKGSRMLQDMESDLRAFSDDNPDDARSRVIRGLLEPIDAARAERDELSREAVSVAALGSPLDRFVGRAVALAAQHEAQLTVVALPLDVQVSSEEWAKYDAEPVDMSQSLALLDFVVETARTHGARGVSLLDPLRLAEPGAFLLGDLHMSRRGHEAVAASLARSLAEPPPSARPAPGMPEGRSRVPTSREYSVVREITVKGSTANRCETKQIREWLRVVCTSPSRGGSAPTGLRLEGAPLEAWGRVAPGRVSFWTPLLAGDDLAVEVQWSDRSEELQVVWDGDAASLAFVQLPARREADVPFVVAVPEGDQRWVGEGARACTRLALEQRAGCLAADRVHLPPCEEGEVSAGAPGHCLPACGAGCERGRCGDWQGAAVCM